MLVEQCTCGAIHVTIGAVTLRLAAGSIGSLAATLQEAARAQLATSVFAPPSLEVLS